MIEHVVDHDCARRRTPPRAPGTAAAARAQSRSVGSSYDTSGGSSRWFARQVGQQRGDRDHGFVLVAHHHRGDAAQPLVHRAATEAVAIDGDAGELDDHVGAGDVGERVGGHDHVVGDPEEERRARHRRAVEQSTIGTTPDASDMALATRPQAWSAATPSLTSAPELATRPTIGMPRSTASRTARSIVWPSGGADRAPVLAAVEVEPADRPAVEVPDRRLDRLAPVPEDRRRRRRLGHSADGWSAGVRISVAL